MLSMDLPTIVYCADIAPLLEESFFAEAYRSVPSSRQQKVDRYRFPKDKFLSLGAGLLLQYAWRKHASSESPMPEICLGPFGKPFWVSSSLFFSLSHSGEKVVCAISGTEIGCDIEKAGTSPSLSVARRFFSEPEQLWLSSHPDPVNFTRIWTLKESFIKAVGKGLSLSLNSFSVCMEDSPVTYSHSLNIASYLGYERGLQEGYCCACCLPSTSGPIPPEFCEISLSEALLD